MSDQEGSGHHLWRELLDFEARYNTAKPELPAADVYRLWSVLWRLSERVRVDYRRKKAAEGKRGANTTQ